MIPRYSLIVFLVVILPFLAWKISADSNDETEELDRTNLQVLTVATKWTESLSRYMRSAKVNGLNVKVLGLGQKWEGGEVRTSPGGGQKVNLVKEALEEMKKEADFQKRIVMFTDSYDVLLLGSPEAVLKQFKMANAKVLFGAESFCWPDESLANDYPEVLRGKRYLNSGGYIGFASDIYELLKTKDIANSDDDQLYFTKLFLNEDLRTKFKIKLDSKSSIFHNLNGATSELELRFAEGNPTLFNTQYNTHPLVLHGNGPTKVVLSSYGNYLPMNWNEESGCSSCWEDMISLADVKDEELPAVLIGMFIEKPTPFLEEFFHKIYLLDYPKNKIHIFLHNHAEFHSKLVNSFVKNYTKEYASMKLILPEDKTKEWHARNLAVEEAVKKKCSYFLSVDSEAHLDNPFTLKLLIEQNRGIVAPLLVRPYKAWSNFWGALTTEGFYARSNDYMDIVKGDRRGLWNVPFISGAYLVNATYLNDEKLRPNYINNLLDADMAFCLNNRNRDIFMHVSNRVDWGHLVNADNFETTHVYNELYQIFDNRWDWELRYLHPNWSQALNPNWTVDAMMKDKETMPCPDVFWFPIVTPRFCQELIDEMENFGQWSDGSNYDARLEGGYENVPTVDIHMNQVGMEAQWLEFLRLYVEPLQSKIYTGYHHYVENRPETGHDPAPTVDIHLYQVGLQEAWLLFLKYYVAPLAHKVYEGYEEPPYASMNFIVRYKPDEQRELKPHHDTSTYTINIALNRPNIDFVGGGCRFTRYDCAVRDTKLGWVLIHPGKLTHQHEGLRVTNGTRYIMISFVDP